MGCSTSSRVIAEQPSPKNQHHGKEDKGLDASLGTVASMSQGGSVSERGSESSTERMPSIHEEIDQQDIDIKGELAKNSVALSKRDRQTSSDILEELRMQGIIKTPDTTTQDRKAGDILAKDEQQQKEFLIDRPKPIISHERSTTGSEISTSEVQKTSNSFQLLSFLNLEEGSWMEKEEVDDKLKSCFRDFNMVESDVTYNTIFETF